LLSPGAAAAGFASAASAFSSVFCFLAAASLLAPSYSSSSSRSTGGERSYWFCLNHCLASGNLFVQMHSTDRHVLKPPASADTSLS
jgi:hypothetical protein